MKHLVECHCYLPQFKEARPPVYHRFVAFSIIDDTGEVIPKHVQCTNCGVIHRVFDIMRSEIMLGRDSNTAILGRDDIKLSLPKDISGILDAYNVDISTWEQAQYIIEHEKWDEYVILTREEHDKGIEGKLLRFLSRASLRVEPYSAPPTVVGHS